MVNSPVRGKFIRMLQELKTYTKFVGAMDPATGRRAAEHFESMGLKTKVLSAPEATELAKLTETTYFGVMIAWAQEVERYCDKAGQKYEEITSFYDEIAFFPPVKYFPGKIGGHCVLPNIELLRKFNDSEILRAIQASNNQKNERDSALGSAEKDEHEKSKVGSKNWACSRSHTATQPSRFGPPAGRDREIPKLIQTTTDMALQSQAPPPDQAKAG